MSLSRHLHRSRGAPLAAADAPADSAGPRTFLFDALPGLAAVAAFLALAVDRGGYPPTRWLPAGLFVLALLAVVGLVGSFRGLPARVRIAIAAVWAYAAWTALSILWADVPADAWTGANRTVLYAAVFSLFAAWRWTPAAGFAVLGVWSLGVAAVGGGTLVAAVLAADPQPFVQMGGRFAAPVGYPNGAAALYLTALFPALLLAVRDEVPRAFRAAGLAAAGTLLQLGLLPQSRASLVALPIGAAVLIAAGPARGRLLASLAAVGAAAAAAHGPLLAVYGSASESQLEDALDAAALAVGISAAALFGVGLVLAEAAQRLPWPRLPAPSRGTVLAAVVLASAAAAVAVVALDAGRRLDAAWAEFKDPDRQAEGGNHFTGGLGSGRYDQWRVALLAARDRPVLGIGADNFAVPYLRLRRTDEEPLYPHSLELMVVSQTGAVGAGLFALWVGAALLAAARSRRALGPLGAAVTGAALAATAYFAVHASVDWLWELPAVGAPAVAWLGLAAGLGPRRIARGSVPYALPGAAVLLAAAAASMALPWLAALEVARAQERLPARPEAAVERLRRAAALNPLDGSPALLEARIRLRQREWSAAHDALGRSLDRNPRNWYAHLLASVAQSHLGRFAAARAEIERARRLNPADAVLDRARERLAERRALDYEQLDRMFAARVAERLG